MSIEFSAAQSEKRQLLSEYSQFGNGSDFKVATESRELPWRDFFEVVALPALVVSVFEAVDVAVRSMQVENLKGRLQFHQSLCKWSQNWGVLKNSTKKKKDKIFLLWNESRKPQEWK